MSHCMKKMSAEKGAFPRKGGGQVSLFISLGQLQANMAKTGKSWILEEKLKID